jgi:hypothetical protein
LPSFAERIKIAIDTLRMRSTYDDGKVNFFEEKKNIFFLFYKNSLV